MFFPLCMRSIRSQEKKAKERLEARHFDLQTIFEVLFSILCMGACALCVHEHLFVWFLAYLFFFCVGKFHSSIIERDFLKINNLYSDMMRRKKKENNFLKQMKQRRRKNEDKKSRIATECRNALDNVSNESTQRTKSTNE